MAGVEARSCRRRVTPFDSALASRSLRWTAPMTPGGTELEVGVIGGNGDSRSSGDRSGFARLSLAWGCAATPYYLDLDRDGDGFGDRLGTTQTGCATSGRAANSTDCNDADAKAFPGGVEVCNGKDDDCDSNVDDGVRIRCGVGWCARFGPTCDPMYCMPGEPRAEECNAFDDDCDGVADNGQPCGPGQTCFEGQCYSEDMPPPVDAGITPEPMPTGCETVPALPFVACVLAVTWRRRVRHALLRRG